MRMQFPSSMPIWEQIERAQKRKQVGRKHDKRIGPTRKKKKQPPDRVKHDAAWRKYRERVILYWAGARDEFPEKPIRGNKT